MLGGKSMRNIDWKKEIFSIPNVLSMIRLALIPLYITIYLNAKSDFHYFVSAGILAVSCLTDLIDGKIARHFNMITTVGKVLDPLADKATQFTLILCLAIRRNLPLLWALIVLFVIKESFQLIAGGIILRKGKILSGAVLPGKISTAVLFITLVLMIMFPNLSNNVINAITVVDGIFLTISFIAYILVYAGKIKLIQDIEA